MTHHHESPGRRSVIFRRQEALAQLTTLMSRVNEWFMSDEGFATDIRGFSQTYAHERCNDVLVFGLLGRSLEEADSLGVVLHRRKAIHALFQTRFETLLTTFLTSHGISSEQMQAVYKLDVEEESATGEHFYRWISATDYEMFVAAFHGACAKDLDPVGTLRRLVEEASTEARRASKRIRVIRPVFDMWNIATFTHLTELLSTSQPRPEHTRAQKKEITRWSNAILQPKFDNATGVYVVQDGREAWVPFVCTWCQTLSDDDFLLFVASMTGQLQASEGGPLQERRQTAWRIFTSLDVHKSAKVDFRQVAPHFKRFGNEKCHKKVIAKWTVKSKSQAGDHTPHWMTLPQLLEFVTDFGGTGTMTEDQVTAELKKIADHLQEVVS